MKNGKVFFMVVTVISVLITLAAVFGMITVANTDLLAGMKAVEETPQTAIEEAPIQEAPVEEPQEYAQIPEGAPIEQIQAMEDAGELPPGTAASMMEVTDHTLILNAWGGSTELEVVNVETGEPENHGFGATVLSRGKVYTFREEYIEMDNCEIISCIARHEDGITSDAWEVYTAEAVEFVDLPAGEEPQVEPNSICFFMHNSETIQGGGHWVILHNYQMIDKEMPSDALFDMPVETNIYAQVNWG